MTSLSLSETPKRITGQSVLMWACAAVFYLYQFVLRVSPSVMTEELQSALSIEACALGALASFYYYGYAGGQIPVGLMLDRVGVRKPLTFASLLCLLGCLLFISGENLILMALGRFLMGAGSAFGFLSALKIATLWLPANRYSFFIGMTLLLGTTGAASATPFSFLVDMIGWREAISFLAALSLVIAGATFFIVRDHHSHKKPDDGEGRSHEFSILESVKLILSNSQTYVIGAYGFLMYVPLSGFADLWGVPYIMSVFKVGKAEATGSVSMFYIGVGIGAPLVALTADFFESLNKPMIYGSLLTCTLMLISLYVTSIPFVLTYVIFLFAGAFSSVQFLAFTTITNVNPTSISSTASGLHNMLCMLSGVIIQPLIGYILDILATNNPESLPGVLYTQSDYKSGLLLVPICLLLASGFALLIRETYQNNT